VVVRVYVCDGYGGSGRSLLKFLMNFKQVLQIFWLLICFCGERESESVSGELSLNEWI
jgi:hypothetical protein